MRIAVNRSNGKDLRLYLPSGLMMNRTSAFLLSASLKKTGTNISGKQLYILFQAAKRYQSAHSEWKLIEVHDQDGETVEIIL